MRRHLALTVPALLALAVTGCGGDDPDVTVVDGPPPSAGGGEEVLELTRSGGCGDAFLWAATEDGTVAVTLGVEIPGHSTIDPTEVAIDLPDPDVSASLLRGDGDLTRNLCVDVLDEEGEPTEEVPLVAGTGTVVTDPVSTDVPLCGDTSGRMELEGVVAEDGTEIPSVSASTESIGCFAG